MVINMAQSNHKVRHAHELEAAGEVRWTGRVKDGLLMIKDEASGEEYQAVGYTHDGSSVRFSLPGDSGPRVLGSDAPGYDALLAVVKKLGGGPGEDEVKDEPKSGRAASRVS